MPQPAEPLPSTLEIRREALAAATGLAASGRVDPEDVVANAQDFEEFLCSTIAVVTRVERCPACGVVSDV